MDQSGIEHELNVLQNNFKEYQLGNTYNNVLLDITPTGSIIASRVGSCFPFKTVTGTYGMHFAWSVATTVGITILQLTLSGIIIRNASASLLWPIYGSSGVGINEQFVHTGTSRFYIGAPGVSRTDWTLGGLILLAAKPTWMDIA